MLSQHPKSIFLKSSTWVIANSGVDKGYIVQVSGKDLILSILPETNSLVCTI